MKSKLLALAVAGLFILTGCDQTETADTAEDPAASTPSLDALSTLSDQNKPAEDAQTDPATPDQP